MLEEIGLHSGDLCIHYNVMQIKSGVLFCSFDMLMNSVQHKKNTNLSIDARIKGKYFVCLFNFTTEYNMTTVLP